MRFYTITDKPIRFYDPSYVPMARIYWGPRPLPEGAEIVGGYSDEKRAGALILLKNGNVVCGISGEISSIPEEKKIPYGAFSYEY